MTPKTLLTALINGTVFGMLALLITWLLGGHASSPFREYFLWHVDLPNLWRLLNFPAYMGLLITGLRGPALLGIFVQWFVIGSIGYVTAHWFLRSLKEVTQAGDERIPPSEPLK
jgi:hypothetical protein